MLEVNISTLGILLFVAMLTSIAADKLRVPYSVGLVAAGVALALGPISVNFPLSKNVVFLVFLPPLVFEAALNIRWPALRRDLPVVVTLAFAGVAVSAGVVAAGMHFIIGWSWVGATLFGSLIAATDPVSVIALFKETRVSDRLHLLVESESLLNDGVAAVLFAVALQYASGEALTAPGIAVEIARSVAGGVAAGGIVAGALLFVAGRTTDKLVEITLTTLAAYGSFLLAEYFHLSGVLASLTAGLVVGNVGSRGTITEANRIGVWAFWEYAAFLANSLIFVLIGGHSAGLPLIPIWKPALVASLIILVARAVAIYPLSALFARSALRIDPRHQHVLVWGGLRGALALALALGLPVDLPQRGAIVLTAFAVVAISIFGQGLTMPLLLRALGLVVRDPPAA
jgi:CPA1 family monovalent cation:H+ antiporter